MTKSQLNVVKVVREKLAGKGWVENYGGRNFSFTAPSGRRRLVVKERNVRSERRVDIDHGPNSYGRRHEVHWVALGSITHKQYLKNLAAKDAARVEREQEVA